jgi:hypothetical protein
MMKRYQLSIFFLFILVAARGWSQESALSLKQAEEISIQNNYQINASLHRLEQGYYGYKASCAYFKPQVNFAGQADAAKEEHSLDGVLRMTQPLYDRVAFFKIKKKQNKMEKLKL